MGKVILITGISTGFGKESAMLLAMEGHSVYGTVRRESESTENVNTLKMDLTDNESVKNCVASVLKSEGRIDVLINNAGMHTGGPVETSSPENIRLQMETNFMGMVMLTREVLPLMRKQGEGMIINISSIGGLMGLPFQAFYSASKFAIEGFSEALRMEVRQFNIKVVVVNPGDFHTNNTANRRNFLTPSSPSDPYNSQFEKTLSVIEKDELDGRDPKILAKKICRIIDTKKPANNYVVSSFEQKLAVVLKNILPGRFFMKILSDHYKIS